MRHEAAVYAKLQRIFKDESEYIQLVQQKQNINKYVQ